LQETATYRFGQRSCYYWAHHSRYSGKCVCDPKQYPSIAVKKKTTFDKTISKNVGAILYTVETIVNIQYGFYACTVLLNQGWAIPVLKGHCPAEFSSNPN